MGGNASFKSSNNGENNYVGVFVSFAQRKGHIAKVAAVSHKILTKTMCVYLFPGKFVAESLKINKVLVIRMGFLIL